MKDVITPDNIANIAHGATGVQIVTLVLLGIIALGVIIWVVKWVIDLKVGTLPNDIAAIRKGLYDLQLQLTKLQGELWSKEEVDARVSAAIKGHIEQCPYHNNK